MKMKLEFFGLGILLTITHVNAQSYPAAYEDCIPNPDVLDGRPVYRLVEEMPVYKDGREAFFKLVMQNIKTKQGARRFGIGSKLGFTFIVDTSGKIRDLCILVNSDYYYFPEGFTKMIKRWKPGRLKGKKVPVRMVISYACIKLG